MSIATQQSQSQTQTQSCACPECDGTVAFTRVPLIGEVARCPDCNAELEVRSAQPLSLELAPPVEEDWGE